MGQYKNVLVVVDLSDDSERVALRAKAVAGGPENNASLKLLHVVEYVPLEPMGETLMPAVQHRR